MVCLGFLHWQLVPDIGQRLEWKAFLISCSSMIRCSSSLCEVDVLCLWWWEQKQATEHSISYVLVKTNKKAFTGSPAVFHRIYHTAILSYAGESYPTAGLIGVQMHILNQYVSCLGGCILDLLLTLVAKGKHGSWWEGCYMNCKKHQKDF